MTSLHADRVQETALPLIDISRLHGNATERQAMLAQLRKASLDTGFFYITGHGVPPALIAQMFAQSKTFFGRPMEEKLRVNAANTPCRHGYEPLREQTLEPDTPPDLKEGYLMGLDLPSDHPIVRLDPDNYGPNQWPQDLDAFAPVMTAYFQDMLRVSQEVLHALAFTLDLRRIISKRSATCRCRRCACCTIPPSRRSRCRAKRGAARTPIGARSPSCCRTTPAGYRCSPAPAAGSTPPRS
jgi:isopenicillin N synthase-like dioxygenase